MYITALIIGLIIGLIITAAARADRRTSSLYLRNIISCAVGAVVGVWFFISYLNVALLNSPFLEAALWSIVGALVLNILFDLIIPYRTATMISERGTAHEYRRSRRDRDSDPRDYDSDDEYR